MPLPDWYYDDKRQVGLDFADQRQVETYDERQGSSGDSDRALLERLGLRSEDAMADIGCGTGVLVREAAWMCAKVIAVDISPAMLRAARGRSEAMGLRNIQFQEAGFLTCDLPEESLNLITTKAALHHLPDFWKGIALTRLARALKPGGQLYISDVVFPCHPAEAPALAEDWADRLTQISGYSRSDAATHIRDEYSTYGWVLEGLIERSGFRLIGVDYVDGVYGRYLAVRK